MKKLEFRFYSLDEITAATGKTERNKNFKRDTERLLARKGYSYEWHRGSGVTIHTCNCKTAVNGISDKDQAGRWVSASWRDNIKDTYKTYGFSSVPCPAISNPIFFSLNLFIILDINTLSLTME